MQRIRRKLDSDAHWTKCSKGDLGFFSYCFLVGVADLEICMQNPELLALHGVPTPQPGRTFVPLPSNLSPLEEELLNGQKLLLN